MFHLFLVRLSERTPVDRAWLVGVLFGVGYGCVGWVRWALVCDVMEQNPEAKEGGLNQLKLVSWFIAFVAVLAVLFVLYLVYTLGVPVLGGSEPEVEPVPATVVTTVAEGNGVPDAGSGVPAVPGADDGLEVGDGGGVPAVPGAGDGIGVPATPGS